jgi:hypothetical protein
MLDFRLEFAWWVTAIFLVIISACLSLSGLGVYYLFSKKFDKITLILAALIILFFIIPKSFNPYHWAESIRIYSDVFFLGVILLTYFALFAIINFTHRLFVK